MRCRKNNGPPCCCTNIRNWITTRLREVLECSESALKSLLFRAYETLRVELAPLVSPTVRMDRVPATAADSPPERVGLCLAPA